MAKQSGNPGRMTQSEQAPPIQSPIANADAAGLAAVAAPTPPAMPSVSVSPKMQGSLPPAASGSDGYARQFYGGTPGRSRRFLPVGLVP
jgi:hypothetical protein